MGYRIRAFHRFRLLGPFLESPELMNPIGCNSSQLANLLEFCNFNNIQIGDGKRLFLYENKTKKQVFKKIKKNIIQIKPRNVRRIEKKINPDSPFAVLQKLL